MPPSRSPTATATGPASVWTRGPGISVQLDPLPWPSRIETSLEPVSATTRSGWPLRSATVMPAGLVPTKKPLAAVDRRAELAVAQAGVDQHVVAAAVGDDQVGDAVAVQVGQRDGAGGEQAGGLVGQRRLESGRLP